MTPARFLFDECFGRPIIEPLAKLIGMGKGEKPQIEHLLNITASGTHDEIWVPRIAVEGWTLITVDGGRQPNKQRGEKLPRLCARYAVTHVVISPTVHQRSSFEKLLTVLSVWYELITIAGNSNFRGDRYLLEPLSSGERGKGRLSKREIAPELRALRDEYLRGLNSQDSD